MKASDLPYDVKQELLSKIRDQIGSTEYRRLVDSIGEDGLVELVLDKAGEMTGSPQPPKKKGRWSRLGQALLISIFILILILAFSNETWGKVLSWVFTIAYGLWMIYLLACWFFEWLSKSLPPYR